MNLTKLLATCWLGILATATSASCTGHQIAPAAPAASCEDAGVGIARKAEKMLREDRREAWRANAELIASRLVAPARESCAADGWSSEARTCIDAMQSPIEFGRCADLLSPEQKAKLTDALLRELAAVSTDSLPTAAAGAADHPAAVSVCDEYIHLLERFTDCDKLAADARKAQQQTLDATKRNWSALRDSDATTEARAANLDACKTALDALRQTAAAIACPL
jgi:hypothetical protein